MSTRTGRLGFLASGILLLMTARAPGAPPARFNYQARLTDSQGAPLKGDHTLHLTLYHGGSAGSADSGVAVFAETALVTAVDGGVAHAVGTGTNTLGGALASSMFDFAGDIFLQVGVDTAGNVVLPRTRLDSVPFALNVPAGGGAVPQGGIIAAEPTVTLPGFTPLGMRIDSPGKWVARQDMPTTRTAAVAAEVNGRIYVIGGAEFLAVFATNEEYDPATDTWATKSPMPNPRQGAAGAVVGGRYMSLEGRVPFRVWERSRAACTIRRRTTGTRSKTCLPQGRRRLPSRWVRVSMSWEELTHPVFSRIQPLSTTPAQMSGTRRRPLSRTHATLPRGAW